MTWGARSMFQYSGATFVSPLSLSGLQIWYDASVLSSITKNGSQQVSQWNDLSGNSRHATAAVVGSDITYDTTKFALGGIAFNTARALDISGCPTSSTWTTVCVMTWTLAGTFAAIGIRANHDNTLAPRAEFLSDGSINNRAVGLNGTAAGNAYQSAGGAIAAGKYCMSYQHTASIGSGLIRANGSSVLSTNNTVAGASAAWTDIGGGRVGTLYTGNGNTINELVTYNRALSLAEIQQVESYLKAKWGTP